MTKKFWADWQKRVGETIQINVYSGYSWGGYAVAYNLLNAGDRIIKITFSGNHVDLVIERHTKTFSGHIHIENEYITVFRNNIKSVNFIKY